MVQVEAKKTMSTQTGCVVTPKCYLHWYQGTSNYGRELPTTSGTSTQVRNNHHKGCKKPHPLQGRPTLDNCLVRGYRSLWDIQMGSRGIQQHDQSLGPFAQLGKIVPGIAKILGMLLGTFSVVCMQVDSS